MFCHYASGMWNASEELGRIKREELLAEARQERLANIARRRSRDDGLAARQSQLDRDGAQAERRRSVSEAPLR